MINPHAGEVALTIGGKERSLKLTLGALAELEESIDEDGGLLALITRFETGAFSAKDVLSLVIAGLRGGGWRDVSAADLMEAEILGGPVEAARAAAMLLVRAFGAAS